MTLKSVVLPAPLGPMMPRISPGAARRLTSLTAVRPPKRLVTASSSSIAPHRAQPLPDPADQALGHEAHDHDEQAAVDDQVDADEPRLEVAERRAQVGLERGDEERAHERADRGAEPADDAVQREAHREVDREDVKRIHEAHVLGPEPAAHRGERGARRDRRDLEAAAWDAERLRRVLVLAHPGKLIAGPRGLEI